MTKRFNTGNTQAKTDALQYLNYLTTKGAIIEIKEIKQTRTNAQNAALWLYFTHCADALNESGIYNSIETITGVKMELTWNKDTFHDKIWIPLQLAAFGTDSTTKLKRNEIDPIYDSICKWMGEIGISVSFPNEFDRYLQMFEK